MTELLLGTRLDAKQQRFAETVSSSGQGLLNVINDILDLSRVEAGKLELHISPFDVRLLIEELGEVFAERAQRKGLELVCMIPPGMDRRFMGDSARLNQILTNLVANAIKFTIDGEIVVRVSEQDDTDDLASVRFEVSDTGCGIADDVQEHVFDSFTQVDGSAARRHGGSGLGLAIARHLAELMGGEIGVDSQSGRGSTFWFTVGLPRATENLSTPQAIDSDLAGTRVLIVAAEATVREVLQQHLSYWDLVYESTADAKEGLEFLHRAKRLDKPFQLAILDISPFDVDGIEMARTIKGDPEISDTKLIQLLAVSEDTDLQHLIYEGINEYLTKPVRQSSLCQVLTNVLDQPHVDTPYAKIEKIESLISANPLKGRVLVVEDNPVNLEVALGMIKSLGCQADSAVDGRAALKAIARKKYDVVLMDCHMPDLGGYAATREIRCLETLKNISPPTPIIALTADALAGDRERCLGAGMNDYLSKPFTQQQLYDVLETWLSEDCSRSCIEKKAMTIVQPIEKPDDNNVKWVSS